MQLAADHERRIEPAFGEHAGDEARRRGLAVRAGDGDAAAEAHQFAEHFGARHDRHAPLARGDEFGIVGLDRARHDQHVDVGDVRRVVAASMRAPSPASRRVAAFSALSEPDTE